MLYLRIPLRNSLGRSCTRAMSSKSTALPPSRETLAELLNDFYEHVPRWDDATADTVSQSMLGSFFGMGGPEMKQKMDDRAKQYQPLVETLVAHRDAADLLRQASTDGRTSLALTILLDQHPRNCYRQPSEMRTIFAKADPLALSLVLDHIVPNGYDVADDIGGKGNAFTRLFFGLPMQHSESIDVQRRAVSYLEKTVAEASEARRWIAEQTLGYARQHHDLIDRFDRYPHRNEAMGREDTEEEAKWKQETGGRPFG